MCVCLFPVPAVTNPNAQGDDGSFCCVCVISSTTPGGDAAGIKLLSGLGVIFGACVDGPIVPPEALPSPLPLLTAAALRYSQIWSLGSTMVPRRVLFVHPQAAATRQPRFFHFRAWMSWLPPPPRLPPLLRLHLHLLLCRHPRTPLAPRGARAGSVLRREETKTCFAPDLVQNVLASFRPREPPSIVGHQAPCTCADHSVVRHPLSPCPPPPPVRLFGVSVLRILRVRAGASTPLSIGSAIMGSGRRSVIAPANYFVDEAVRGSVASLMCAALLFGRTPAAKCMVVILSQPQTKGLAS